jgi:hypothetical protein
MLENPSPDTHALQRRSKASAIIARSIVLSSITFEVEQSEVDPKSARRMSHHRMGTFVSKSVSSYVPWIDSGEAEVRTIRFYEESDDGRHPRFHDFLLRDGFLLLRRFFPPDARPRAPAGLPAGDAPGEGIWGFLFLTRVPPTGGA